MPTAATASAAALYNDGLNPDAHRSLGSTITDNQAIGGAAGAGGIAGLGEGGGLYLADGGIACLDVFTQAPHEEQPRHDRSRRHLRLVHDLLRAARPEGLSKGKRSPDAPGVGARPPATAEGSSPDGGPLAGLVAG